MYSKMSLQTLLATPQDVPAQPLEVFSLLTLGILEALANGLMSATDALRVFFHADNCLYVRKHLHNKMADAVMSHGVQLPDLFEALPVAEAHREFQRELATIRALCLQMSTVRLISAGSRKKVPDRAKTLGEVHGAPLKRVSLIR